MKLKPDNCWVISDTHFHHSAIIHYSDRPFNSVEEMDEKLVENWNKVVMPSDQVLFLGDFCLGGKTEIKRMRDRLKGEIIMVMGNHDKNYNERVWHEIGFKEVHRYPFVWEKFWIFSHEPLEWVSEKLPLANICGHVHEKNMWNMTNHHKNVCVEHTGYKPLLLAELIEDCTKNEWKEKIYKN